MGMNWGGFAGGLAQGLNTGMAMGDKINGLVKQHKLAEVHKAGLAEANAARDAAMAVKDNGAQQGTQPTQPTSAAGVQATEGGAQVTTYAIDQPGPAGGMPAAPAAPAVQPAARRVGPDMGMEPEAPQAQPAPAANVAATMGVKKRYSVGDQGFDSIGEANDYVAKNKPSVMDFMDKTLVPKMQEFYLAEGDAEKAEAWGAWAQERKNKKYMETWGNAMHAAESGDYDTAADHVAKLHSQFNDGYTVTARDKVKDKDGNVTGMSITFKDDKTGKTTTQTVDPKALVRMGLAGMSPEKRFLQMRDEQKQADMLGAKAAIDAQNDTRTLVREELRDRRRDQREDEHEATRHKNRVALVKLEESLRASRDRGGGGGGRVSAVRDKLAVLREAGLDDATIKDMIPHIVGGDGYKKPTSPVEQRSRLVAGLVDDYAFKKMPDAEKNRHIDNLMALSGYAPKAAPTAPAAAGMPKPAAAAPAPAAPPAGKKPYKRPDGTVVYL